MTSLHFSVYLTFQTKAWRVTVTCRCADTVNQFSMMSQGITCAQDSDLRLNITGKKKEHGETKHLSLSQSQWFYDWHQRRFDVGQYSYRHTLRRYLFLKQIYKFWRMRGGIYLATKMKSKYVKVLNYNCSVRHQLGVTRTTLLLQSSSRTQSQRQNVKVK